MITQEALGGWLDGQPTHSSADIAAAIASVGWFETDAARLVDQVAEPMWRRLYTTLGATDPAVALVVSLQQLLADAAGAGARLGFALATAAGDSARGWPAWATAADVLLAGTGCGEAAHREDLLSSMRELATAAGGSS